MTSCNDTFSDKEFSDDSGWIDEVEEVPKSATKALQAYIEEFEKETTPKRTRDGCYAGSVSSLLSSKPKSASSPGTLKRLPKTSGDMVDNLITWIKASYTKDLHRKILPYGSGSVSSLDKLYFSELEETGSNDDDRRSVWSNPGTELSTLPSPGSSMASDIESNMESVSTDMLLQSYYAKGNSKLRKGPIHRKYPSWVEDLTTQTGYPSWVDDINKTLDANDSSFNVIHQNQRNDAFYPNKTTPHQSSLNRSRLSKSLSPSFFHHHSDLHQSPPSFMSTSLQDHRHKYFTKPQRKKNEAWDLESTDTEVLISQSMYGRQPVNMGGSLHSSLYRDKKIQQLLEENMRKIVKRTHPSSTKEKSSPKPRTLNEKVLPINKSDSAFSFAKVKLRPVITSSPLRNTVPLSRIRQPVNERRAILSSRADQIPFINSKNPELLLEERKKSLDSSDTDKLMRQSPTGIHMDKRNYSKLSKTPRTQITRAKNTTNETPRVRQTSQQLASEKLTKLIASAKKTSDKNKSQVEQRHSGERNTREAPVIPPTTSERFLTRINKGNDVRKVGSSTRNTPKSTSQKTSQRLSRRYLTEEKKVHALSAQNRDDTYSKLTNVDYWTNGVSSVDRHYLETDSISTDALVIHPPMPLFDVSPSLTTETVSSMGRSDGSADIFLEQQALKTSFLMEEDDLVSSSGTSYMDFVRSPDDRRAPVTGMKAEPRRNWERNKPNTESRVSSKPGIITSFLEDCMRSSQESRLEEDAAGSCAREESSADVIDRPVETLKKMIFKVQSLAPQTEDERSSDREITSENGDDTATETVTEEMLSDVILSEIPDGDNALSRAYYHLARLKKLVSISEKVAGLK